MSADALSVLVVDENPAILDLISRLLDREGIRALLARNSSEALEIAAKSYVPIDLILTDVTSPERTGASIVEQVALIRSGIRAVYMSAREEDGVIRLKLGQRDGHWHPLPSAEKSLAEILHTAAAEPKSRHGSGSADSFERFTN